MGADASGGWAVRKGQVEMAEWLSARGCGIAVILFSLYLTRLRPTI